MGSTVRQSRLRERIRELNDRWFYKTEWNTVQERIVLAKLQDTIEALDKIIEKP